MKNFKPESGIVQANRARVGDTLTSPEGIPYKVMSTRTAPACDAFLRLQAVDGGAQLSIGAEELERWTASPCRDPRLPPAPVPAPAVAPASPVLPPELVTAVRAHARKNYEKGWDIIVEAWDDADILKAIGVSKTSMGAIREIGKIVRLQASAKAEVLAEVF